MPRSLNFLRLSRGPNHRLAMMKNMTISLINHERIKTTNARASEMLRKINRIFCDSFTLSDKKKAKVISWIRLKPTIQKFYGDLWERYPYNRGGIAKLTPVGERRKGDNSEMAIIELLNK
jgi:large subunit ribosomal protein L17